MPLLLRNEPRPLLLWTLILACILLLMTTNAVRTEVLNLDRSSEEEKERSKDGKSVLMAMAIAQDLLKKKKELAVCKDENARLVEQGPAANQPVDDSQSLVHVDESQGRRGAMAGCISQGGSGCNTAFTFASGNRAGNSEDDEDDLAEIESKRKGGNHEAGCGCNHKGKGGNHEAGFRCNHEEYCALRWGPGRVAAMLKSQTKQEQSPEQALGMSRRPQQGQVLSTEWS